MRISKISVKGLFGYLDHEIPLNQESRITIIHGPNGVGKTVLMGMVDELFNLDFALFSKIRFDEFCVEFDSGEAVIVRKHNDTKEISFSYADSIEREKAEFTPKHQKLLTPLQRIYARFWEQKDTWSQDAIIKKMLRDKVGEFHPVLHNNWDYPNWLKRICNKHFVSLVHTQRHVRTQNPSPIISSKVVSARPLVLSMLALFVTSHIIASYWRQLSVFTKTLLITIFLPVLTIVVLLLFLNIYFRYSTRFWEFLIELPVIFSTISESLVRRRLIEDTEEQEILFESLINDCFRNKSIELDEDEGFIIFGQDDEEISESMLASGEKHLLYLYYYLIFLAERDTLVMIDEPELSLHVRWQREFLNDLQLIVKMQGIDILVATHSPQIVADKHHWLVELDFPGSL